MGWCLAIRWNRILRTAAHLMLGALLGGWAALLGAAGHVHRLTLESARLAERAKALTMEVTELQKSLKDRRNVVLRKIEVTVQGAPELRQLQIERAVTTRLQPLLGMEAIQLDPLVVANIVEGRIFETGGERLHLRVVSTHLAGDRLVMVVKAVTNGTSAGSEPVE